MTMPCPLAVLALTLAACSDPAPANPTWAEDVAPILAANCVRCHSNPVIGGAPERIRLDVADEVDADEGNDRFGARIMSEFIAARAADGTMPPGFPLTGRQIEILENWSTMPPGEDGFGPARGGPAAGNHLPVMELLGDSEVLDDGRVVVQYLIDDPDDDLVTGTLSYEGSAAGVITHELGSGRGQFSWDIAALPAGTYDLFAMLDDASGATRVEVGSIRRVKNPLGHAPTVSLGSAAVPPALLTDVIPAAVDPFVIEVSLADLDGDDLSLTVQVIRGHDEVVMALVPDEPGGTVFTWPAGFSLDDGQDLEDGLRLLATVTDGTFTRQLRSFDFSVGRAAPTYTWTDVQGIFRSYCSGCHPAAGRIPYLFLDLDGDDYEKVARLSSAIYRRAVQQRNMPPVSATLLIPDQSPMPDEAREILRAWLLAGSPE